MVSVDVAGLSEYEDEHSISPTGAECWSDDHTRTDMTHGTSAASARQAAHTGLDVGDSDQRNSLRIAYPVEE